VRSRRTSFRAAIAASAALTASTVAAPGQAAKFRRPFNVSVGVNYGYDNNGGGGCTDYGCGGVCYDGHSGTDFPLGVGTTVVAAANGRVGATYNGCANYGGLGNTCGGRCGNYVRIDYPDGTSTLYCHLELNSIAVSTGQQVSCGQAIARSASSGNSSGPHLHFGLKVGGVNRDPFAGNCSQSTSYWVGQGSYPHPIPSSECENVCACNPGQVQSEICGNCGTRQRSCGSDCQWEGWSSCTGQGECAAGSVEPRDCCDCGTQTRRCSGQCTWEAWGSCEGPDPNGGNDTCETGEPGICSEGRVRCREGCRACVRLHEPRSERCDDVDEDCDGTLDNGFPQEIGDPAPLMAARLVDHSHPQVLEAGGVDWAWATFRNEGRATWLAWEVWLMPASVLDGEKSPFSDPDNWPAFDVAAVVEEDVAPGDTVAVAWSLRARDKQGKLEDTFQLSSSDGTLLRCPTPHVDVSVLVTEARSAEEAPLPNDNETNVGTTGESSETSGCACRVRTGSSGRVGWWGLVAGILWAVRRRRRGC